MFKRTIGGMTLPALAILGLVLAHTTTAQAQSTPSGDLFIDVIVTLDPAFAPGGHAANKAQAADIASDLGKSASSTYGTAVFGFAGPVPLNSVGAVPSRKVSMITS